MRNDNVQNPVVGEGWNAMIRLQAGHRGAALQQPLQLHTPVLSALAEGARQKKKEKEGQSYHRGKKSIREDG